jgi:hypothetical protein
VLWASASALLWHLNSLRKMLFLEFGLMRMQKGRTERATAGGLHQPRGNHQPRNNQSTQQQPINP